MKTATKPEIKTLAAAITAGQGVEAIHSPEVLAVVREAQSLAERTDAEIGAVAYFGTLTGGLQAAVEAASRELIKYRADRASAAAARAADAALARSGKHPVPVAANDDEEYRLADKHAAAVKALATHEDVHSELRRRLEASEVQRPALLEKLKAAKNAVSRDLSERFTDEVIANDYSVSASTMALYSALAVGAHAHGLLAILNGVTVPGLHPSKPLVSNGRALNANGAIVPVDQFADEALLDAARGAAATVPRALSAFASYTPYGQRRAVDPAMAKRMLERDAKEAEDERAAIAARYEARRRPASGNSWTSGCRHS